MTKKLSFAMPVLRPGSDGSYAASTGTLSIVHDLREAPGEAARPEALEIGLAASASRRLYAMFEGAMSWNPTGRELAFPVFPVTGPKDDRAGRLEGLNRSCQQLRKILYQNVEPASVVKRCQELLLGAWESHAAHREAPLPRVLTGRLTLPQGKPGSVVRAKARKERVRWVTALQAFEGRESQRAPFVAAALNGSFELLISSGDCVADVPDVGAAQPLAIRLQDEVGNALSPVFLLHLLMAKRGKIETGTPVGIDVLLTAALPVSTENKARIHPLLLELASKTWGPFKEMTGRYVLKEQDDTPPLFLPSSAAASPATLTLDAGQEVKAFHGFPPAEVKSLYAWRLGPDLYLRYRNRDNNPVVPDDKDESWLTFTRDAWKKAQEIWEAHGEQINLVARTFSLPCEILLAFACHESTGDPRACRFERNTVSARFEKLGNRRFHVPTDLSEKVGREEFTWNEILAALDGAILYMVSPGLMQTLVSTAQESLGRLRQNPARLEILDITLPDLTRGRDVFLWLLDPLRSLIAGAAYLETKALMSEVGYDPPKLGGAYNRGSLIPSTKNPFYILTNKNYLVGDPLSFLSCYNAAVRLFARSDLGLRAPYARLR